MTAGYTWADLLADINELSADDLSLSAQIYDPDEEQSQFVIGLVTENDDGEDEIPYLKIER